MPYHWGSMCHPVFQYLFETVMGCLVPFSLISTCYSSVICRLQSAKFQRRGQGSRLILLIIVTFAIFWLPYHVVNIIEVILLMQLLVVVSESVAWRLSLFNFGFWMHLDQLTRQTVRRAIVSGTSAFKARLWPFWEVSSELFKECSIKQIQLIVIYFPGTLCHSIEQSSNCYLQLFWKCCIHPKQKKCDVAP